MKSVSVSNSFLLSYPEINIFILLMVTHRCGMVVSHGRTNELPSSVVPRNAAWVVMIQKVIINKKGGYSVRQEKSRKYIRCHVFVACNHKYHYFLCWKRSKCWCLFRDHNLWHLINYWYFIRGVLVVDDETFLSANYQLDRKWSGFGHCFSFAIGNGD